jgi:hypothetical protein
MLVLKSIDKEQSKAVIECNGMPFTMNMTYDLRNRGIEFDTYTTDKASVPTHESIVRFGLEAVKHSKNINMDVHDYSARITLESTFEWDKETKTRIRGYVNEERTKMFRELIIDSGLMKMYKAFKEQGAKLVIKESIINRSYHREDPYIYFPAKKMFVVYNTKDKKFVAFITHGNHRKSRVKESRGTACTAEKMMKKLEKMFLREFLGMPHNGVVE